VLLRFWSILLILLRSLSLRALIGLVAADYATSSSTERRMMSCEMARSATDQSSLEASVGVRRTDANGKCYRSEDYDLLHPEPPCVD
jgi:hypothetical protein